MKIHAAIQLLHFKKNFSVKAASQNYCLILKLLYRGTRGKKKWER